jgi:hypothetical protein
VLENTNYIYQDNETSASILSVIKKIKPLQKSWLQLSRTTEPQARQHRTTRLILKAETVQLSARREKRSRSRQKFKP